MLNHISCFILIGQRKNLHNITPTLNPFQTNIPFLSEYWLNNLNICYIPHEVFSCYRAPKTRLQKFIQLVKWRLKNVITQMKIEKLSRFAD